MAVSLVTPPAPIARPYGAAQEIEYLYLEAELEVLWRQLQELQAPTPTVANSAVSNL